MRIVILRSVATKDLERYQKLARGWDLKER